MKRIALFLVALLIIGTAAFAHGSNEHVRGTVTEVSTKSATVQTAPKVIKTLTLSDKTIYKGAGRARTSRISKSAVAW